MNPKVERIEVYVDEAKEPIQVLTQPPFEVELDTRTLADGEHRLRIVTVFKDGSREERELAFEVDNLPDAFVDGIDEGQRVRGQVRFNVLVGDYEKPKGSAAASGWLYVLSTALVLALVWIFFAVSPTSEKAAAQMAAGKETEAQAPASGGAPVDKALFEKGKELYTANCASCHQANGKGLPGAFPALAGSKVVADVRAAVEKITKGGNGMPAFSQFSPEELAAVLTYVRNDFGNHYGGVSVEEVKKLLGGGSASGEGAAQEPKPAADNGLLAEGEKVYLQNCASCHQPDGSGMPPMFPALRGNAKLKDAKFVIERILKGKSPMPPFAQLSDRQVAAVATFVRAKLNDFGPVSEDEVKALR